MLVSGAVFCCSRSWANPELSERQFCESFAVPAKGGRSSESTAASPGHWGAPSAQPLGQELALPFLLFLRNRPILTRFATNCQRSKVHHCTKAWNCPCRSSLGCQACGSGVVFGVFPALFIHPFLVTVPEATSGELLCIFKDSTKRRKTSHFWVPRMHLETGVAGLWR